LIDSHKTNNGKDHQSLATDGQTNDYHKLAVAN